MSPRSIIWHQFWNTRSAPGSSARSGVVASRMKHNSASTHGKAAQATIIQNRKFYFYELPDAGVQYPQTCSCYDPIEIREEPVCKPEEDWQAG